jgi:myo-inositol-1(or 4)-monophosphatase
MFLGSPGHGATLNGRPMRASARVSLEGARMIGQRSRFADRRWKMPWPRMDIEQRQSIAYRMALVGAGQADATILFGWKNEWDIAAGAAIVEAAGGSVSDPWGARLVLNQTRARVPGVVAASAGLHPLIIERTAHLPDPRQANET